MTRRRSVLLPGLFDSDESSFELDEKDNKKDGLISSISGSSKKRLPGDLVKESSLTASTTLQDPSQYSSHGDVKSPILRAEIFKIQSKSKLKDYISHDHLPGKQKKTDIINNLKQLVVPIGNVFQNYSKNKLMGDMIGGLLIAIQLLPKGMAYAMMAGLDKSTGILVAIFSTLGYPIAGSTIHLCTGPDPIICLLISNMLTKLNYNKTSFEAITKDYKYDCSGEDEELCKELHRNWSKEKSSIICTVTFLTFLFQFLAGLVGFGFLSNFVSYLVVESFVCSASLVILVKQLHYCLNIRAISGSSTFIGNIGELFSEKDFFTNFVDKHLITIILTIATLVILFGLHFWAHNHNAIGHKIAEKIPGVLLVVVMGIVFAQYTRASGKCDNWYKGEHHVIELVGSFSVNLIPNVSFVKLKKGNSWSDWPLDLKYYPKSDSVKVLNLYDLMYHSLVIALVSFFCSMVVSRKLSVSKGYNISPDNEMIGLSLANFGNFMYSAFPCGGILATSMAASHTPAKTQLYSIATSLLMISMSQISIICSFISDLPKCILSAIVMETVIPLISFKSLVASHKVLRIDTIQYVVCMLVCLTYGVESGITAGMIISIIELVYRGTRHRVYELGRIPKSVSFKKINNHANALVNDRIIVVRIMDSLHFTNWYPCQTKIDEIVKIRNDIFSDKNKHILGLVINLVTCGSIDVTASYGILQYTKKLAKQGIVVRLSCVNDSVLHKLQRIRIYKIKHNLGVIPYKFYTNDHDAVLDILEKYRAMDDQGIIHWEDAISKSPSDSHSTSTSNSHSQKREHEHVRAGIKESSNT